MFCSTHQIFVEESWNEEHEHSGDQLAIASLHGRHVHVPQGPTVHGHIPSAPKYVDVGRVPPIVVEVAIGEVQKLAHQIQKRVEGQIEETQPDQMVGNLQRERFNDLQ